MYYGLFRISEMTAQHAVRAKDVHINDDADKILIILRSSKTHGVYNKPQEIRIRSSMKSTNRNFCPVEAANEYMDVRGRTYVTDDEQLFIFRDRSPVSANNARQVLKDLLTRLNLNPKLYGTHSFRSGHATDLTKYGHSVESVKLCGRWTSNAVYKYIKS